MEKKAKKKKGKDLGHLLSDFGQVLPLLPNDEAMKPGRSRDGGHRVAVGLKKKNQY